MHSEPDVVDGSASKDSSPSRVMKSNGKLRPETTLPILGQNENFTNEHHPCGAHLNPSWGPSGSDSFDEAEKLDSKDSESDGRFKARANNIVLKAELDVKLQEYVTAQETIAILRNVATDINEVHAQANARLVRRVQKLEEAVVALAERKVSNISVKGSAPKDSSPRVRQSDGLLQPDTGIEWSAGEKFEMVAKIEGKVMNSDAHCCGVGSSDAQKTS